MKLKKFSLLPCVFLLLSLYACAGRGESGKSVSPAEYAGYYLAVEIAGGENSASREEMVTYGELGLYVTLTLCEDGTGELDMFGAVMSITWDGESFDAGAGGMGLFAFEDGLLRMSTSGDEDSAVTIVFEKIDALPEVPEEAVEEDDADADSGEKEAGTADPAPTEIHLAETVLFDGENVKITATGIRGGGWAGPELLLTFENNTDQTLAFTCEDLYINGCKVGRGLYTEVGAGMTADDAMSVYDVDLAAYGIDVIAEITLSFRVIDGDWDTYCLTDLITVRTDAPETYVFTFEPGGEVLYEGKGLKIVSLGRAGEDSYWGPATLLYFENNTKRTVTFQTRDASVDGHRLDAILSTTLHPGMCAIDDLSVDKGELARYGGGEIRTLALRFLVFNDETGDEILATNEIKFIF